MKAKAAKYEADRVNEPRLQQQINEIPLQHIYDTIKEAAKKGFYALNFELGHNVAPSVTRYYEEKLLEFGYQVGHEIKGTMTNLKINWFDAED